MGVALHNTVGNIDTSTSATTIPFSTPTSPTAGEIWICSAAFRAGSTVTISGVPAAFTLIKRVDSGSGATNVTIVSYWYLALGTESGTFDTITLSSASKHETVVSAYSGCNTTAPILGTVVTGTGTTSANTANLAASTASQAVIVVGGGQGVAGATEVFTSIAGNNPISDASLAGTTGGSSATNVCVDNGHLTGAAQSSVGYLATSSTSSTAAAMAFILDNAPSIQIPRLLVNQAIKRASVY